MLTAKDRARLQGVHPDLVKVVERAAGMVDVPFTVLEGVRTVARQRQLVAAGASRTMKSRHLTGHAVDLGALVNGKVRWDWPLYLRLATSLRAAAISENVPVEWGGTWKRLSAGGPVFEAADLSKSFPDGPHYQLPFSDYP